MNEKQPKKISNAEVPKIKGGFEIEEIKMEKGDVVLKSENSNGKLSAEQKDKIYLEQIKNLPDTEKGRELKKKYSKLLSSSAKVDENKKEQKEISNSLKYVKEQFEEGKNLKNSKDLKNFVDSLTLDEKIKARQIFYDIQRQKKKGKLEKEIEKKQIEDNQDGVFEVQEDEENLFGYKKLNRVLDKDEGKKVKEKLEKLQGQEKERRKENIQSVKEQKEEEKKNKKGFFKRLFSKNTLKFGVETAKDIGLKMSGLKAFTLWRESRHFQKNKKAEIESFKDNNIPEHISDLVDVIKNGDNSEENKVLRIELKNKLREEKETNPEQYKKAVEVLFKSRNQKNKVKEEVLKNLEKTYSKEELDRKRELAKESINTALIWMGAITGGATAYGAVITRTFNNIGFTAAKQFENKDGKIQFSEMKNIFKNISKNWQEKSAVGKISTAVMYGALGYMLYNGYDMSKNGTIDEYNTLVGKIIRGELPYYPTGDEKSVNTGKIETTSDIEADGKVPFAPLKDAVDRQEALADYKQNVAEAKNTYKISVEKDSSIWKVLEREDSFWEKLGAEKLTDQQKENVIGNIVKRLQNNSEFADLKEEFLNLNSNENIDLMKLQKVIDQDIEVKGQKFDNLIQRADMLDGHKDVLSYKEADIDQYLHPKTAQEVTVIENSDPNDIIEKTHDPKNAWKTLDLKNAGKVHNGFYEITSKDGAKGMWGILREEVFKNAMNLDKPKGAELSLDYDELNNLTANTIERIKYLIAHDKVFAEKIGIYNVTEIYPGQKLNVELIRDKILNKRFGNYETMVDRARDFDKPNITFAEQNAIEQVHTQVEIKPKPSAVYQPTITQTPEGEVEISNVAYDDEKPVSVSQVEVEMHPDVQSTGVQSGTEAVYDPNNQNISSYPEETMINQNINVEQGVQNQNQEITSNEKPVSEQKMKVPEKDFYKDAKEIPYKNQGIIVGTTSDGINYAIPTKVLEDAYKKLSPDEVMEKVYNPDDLLNKYTDLNTKSKGIDFLKRQAQESIDWEIKRSGNDR
ncbi:hypothetical protein CSB11_01630 [Candidatus Campbellbacteria bacterium]|nr:MAG: hypothetical protein CSB11_01630 [Candidatus Campbellbacteria bacterium]